MKITFIKPAIGDYISSDAMEPLVFAILKALTSADVECVLFDDRIEKIDYQQKTDLVAITVETFTAKRAYIIAQEYRKRGIPVVMGGFHPSLVQDEVMRHCDSIVIGDAEKIWRQIVSDAKKRALKKVYKSETWPSMAGIIPDRSIFKGKKYIPLHLVQFARGCKFNCDFCSVHSFYGRTLRQRNVEDIVEEIRGLENKTILFADDNIFVNKEKALLLLNALVPLNAKWCCQVSIDITKDQELLSLMKKSGCFAVLMGMETLNPDNLKQMNKQWNKPADYQKALKTLNKHGIMSIGTFVIGYDYDTPETFDNILDFAVKNKLFLAHFNPLVPTPGTRLFERLQKENRLLDHPWWLHPDYRYGKAMFKPAGMTPKELEQGCYRIRLKFNSYPAILKRSLDFKANLSTFFNSYIFFMSNYITRKELKKKQGVPLEKKEKNLQ